MKKILFGCAWLLSTFVMAVDAQSLDTAEAQIIQVLKNQFERPVTHLDVPVVVVSGDYAVADWLQDNQGGRALLRQDADGWRTLMCSGVQFKSPQALRQAGVQENDATSISLELSQKEQNLTKEQLKKIDSFQGIVDVLTNPDHHEHH
jgi:hypothetical protein